MLGQQTPILYNQRVYTQSTRQSLSFIDGDPDLKTAFVLEIWNGG